MHYTFPMTYTTLFIDLDGTLYPNGLGLWEEISQRIDSFMEEKLGIPCMDVPRFRQTYFHEYGTTLRGIQANHPEVDAGEYLNFVHAIPLDKYIQTDPKLRQMLLALPQQKWIFTNADKNHAQRVLNVLGIADCFDGIIDVWALDFRPKPVKEIYPLALKLAGEEQAEHCIYIDDLAKNLVPARELGMQTVLVSPNGVDPSVHHTIPRIHDLPSVLPDLFR